ncbi:MAG: hypothetical protein O6922_05760 [Chloroflexi bacterium]|nr:hypothetical protein [Chloroflexota bacterium]
MLESALGSDPLTAAEADAIDICISDDTVRSVFVGQLDRDAGGLSDATVICIGEQIGGMSAAALFTDEPALDATISSLQGVFCLNNEERAAISASNAAYGFGDFGGIDAIECVVNGVGPTGLGDLMGALSSSSSDDIDFAALSDLFPLLIECGAISDSALEGTGVTADQVGCLLSALGESGLALLDPAAAEPELADLIPILAALEECGIALDDLLGGATLPLDPGSSADPTVVPTVQTESPQEAAEIAGITELFTEEQITCLTAEIGAEEIAKLLAGGAPDLSLFAALATCDVDLLSLLAP